MMINPGQVEAECRVCHKALPLEEFTPTRLSRYPDGRSRHSQCKRCRSLENAMRGKKRWVKDSLENPRAALYTNAARRYGLTWEEVDAMIIASSGLCAICDHPFRNSEREPSIDHHHKSGQVRELLCIRCNLAVGVMENVRHARKVLAYIKRHR